MAYRINYKKQKDLERTQLLNDNRYVGGCGFERQTNPDGVDKNQPYEVVATYADCENYAFSYPDTRQKKTIHQLASMIRKKLGHNLTKAVYF